MPTVYSNALLPGKLRHGVSAYVAAHLNPTIDAVCCCAAAPACGARRRPKTTTPKTNQKAILHGFANPVSSTLQYEGPTLRIACKPQIKMHVAMSYIITSATLTIAEPCDQRDPEQQLRKESLCDMINGYHDQANNHVTDMFELSPPSGSRRLHLPLAHNGLSHHVHEAEQTARKTWY